MRSPTAPRRQAVQRILRGSGERALGVGGLPQAAQYVGQQPVIAQRPAQGQAFGQQRRGFRACPARRSI